MRRLYITLITCLLVVLLFAGATYAEGQIVESQDIKIIINGKTGTFASAPITVNDRTLLPLRSLITELGVQNDDQHIIWNEAESSVTIKKDNTSIYLKEGSNEAQVNNLAVALDAAPVSYKDRVYVPARLVAQAFGKKVVWYEATNTVLIRDEAEFNRVREIIEKSDIAMNDLKSVAFKQNTTAEIVLDGKSQNIEASAEGKMDREKLKGIINAEVLYKELNKTVKLGSYMSDKTEYTKDPDTGKWEKGTLEDEGFQNIFRYSSYTSDAAYAGLTVEEGPNPEELVLKGCVFPENSYRQKLSSFYIDSYSLDEIYYEIYINKKTSYITKTFCDLKGKATILTASAEFRMKSTETSGSFNEALKIEAPADLN